MTLRDFAPIAAYQVAVTLRETKLERRDELPPVFREFRPAAVSPLPATSGGA
jgi:hypothetical protein